MRVVPSAAYTYEVCGFGGVRRLAGSALYASVADFVASPSSAATGNAAAATTSPPSTPQSSNTRNDRPRTVQDLRGGTAVSNRRTGFWANSQPAPSLGVPAPPPRAARRPAVARPSPVAVVLDQRVAAVGLGESGPHVRAGRADRAEDGVAGTRAGGVDRVPAVGVVAGDEGVLVAGHRVEEGTDRPHGPVGGRDAGEVRERAADPGQDGGLPAPVAQVRHQRPALCGRVVGLPGGPDLSIVDGHGVEQRTRYPDRDDAPVPAVPVLDKRLVGRRVVALADRPHVVRPAGGHRVKVVAAGTRVRTGHDAPGAPVEVLHERGEPAVAVLPFTD